MQRGRWHVCDEERSAFKGAAVAARYVDPVREFGRRSGLWRVHAFLHRESFGATDFDAIAVQPVSLVPYWAPCLSSANTVNEACRLPLSVSQPRLSPPRFQSRHHPRPSGARQPTKDPCCRGRTSFTVASKHIKSMPIPKTRRLQAELVIRSDTDIACGPRGDGRHRGRLRPDVEEFRQCGTTLP